MQIGGGGQGGGVGEVRAERPAADACLSANDVVVVVAHLMNRNLVNGHVIVDTCLYVGHT